MWKNLFANVISLEVKPSLITFLDSLQGRIPLTRICNDANRARPFQNGDCCKHFVLAMGRYFTFIYLACS